MSDQADAVRVAARLVRAYERATASLLQRRMKIEYAKADELLERLEIISPPDELGHRHVI